MIIGVGTDTVAIESFSAQLEDKASGFLDATFTAQEQHTAKARASGKARIHLAARFAAKEALIKAWSGGFFGEQPALQHVDMREIEVVNDRFGRPALHVHGRVAAVLNQRLPGYRAHLSLTHDGPCASAFVVLEGGQ